MAKPEYKQYNQVRASKSGMNADLQKKMLENYSLEAELQVKQWVEEVIGISCEGSFLDWLRDGAILSLLMNTIEPGSVPPVKKSSMPFKQMECINLFLIAAEKYGIKKTDLFVTLDLYEGNNPSQVVSTLRALDRLSQAKGFKGPTYAPKQSAYNPRDFSEEKINAGYKMAREYDHLFKLLIIGDTSVGKSSILLRFADNLFSGTYITTIGVDFKIRTMEMNGEKIKLQIWDTAGQERFRTITATYYRGTHGVIIVYDVTNADSFNNVKRWITEIENNCDYVDKVLVGNKDDVPEKKVVLRPESQRLADSQGMTLYETSAKENINIEEVFDYITKKVLQTKKEKATKMDTQNEKIILGKKSAQKGKKNCCN